MSTRRSFLTRTGLATAVAGLPLVPSIALSQEKLLSAPGQKPKRIIHIVSDGMSTGTLSCADQLMQLKHKRPLTWIQLLNKPETVLAMMDMRSLNSLVTDSSAASSSWGSGSRVVNGTLNTLPDGTRLTPLYDLFHQAGWKTGLVTTAEITHATPAGFAVSVDSRANAPEIATEYLKKNIEVLLGGGTPAFKADNREDKRDVSAEFTALGYTHVETRDAMLQAPEDKKLLGTFAGGHLPYMIDQQASPELMKSVPTLAEMTEVALARLGRHEKFILQVEGARIDHAAHNSDAAAALTEQIALDTAIDVCIAYQRQHPDTLIVITTDHGNSNLGLNGKGGGYSDSSQAFSTVQSMKMSFASISKILTSAGEKIPDTQVKKLGIGHGEFVKSIGLVQALKIEPSKVREILSDCSGCAITEEQATMFARVVAGEAPQMYSQMNPVVTQLGQLLANHHGIGWTGNTHTSDYVPLMAIGPGSEHFKGFLPNTQIFANFTKLAGIDFKNPSVPLLAEAGPSAYDAEYGRC